MTPQEWSRIQQGIFRGESGGDYGALFGYQNRPNGRFEGTDLTKMTVDQALDFAKPSGPYGQYVKGEVGRVATPMGAYQVVGTTLRDAKNSLGLTGNEVMDQGLQDRIGQWIHKTQGTGAWEGYKPVDGDQAIASDTMRALGKQPNGLLGASQAPNNTESKMIPEEKPRGLLGSLGIQKMEEGAEGEAGQRFFERDTFKDTAANLAQGFAAMGSSPALQKMTADVASQRTESKAKNKTIEYLRANGRGDLADAVESGSLGIRDAAGIMFANPKAKTTAAEDKIARIMSTGVSEEAAIGIVDGRYVAVSNPVTNETDIIDKATGKKVFGAGQAGDGRASVSTETPSVSDGSGVGSMEGTDPTKATGLTGYANSWINAIADTFGQELPAPDAATAKANMESLWVRTIALAETEFAGKPTNFLRERVEQNLAIKPGQISMGPRAALERANVVIKMLQETSSGANAAINGNTATVEAKRKALDTLPKVSTLLRDYESLRDSLSQALTPKAGSGLTQEQNDLLDLLAPETKD
jgi:hypothetical protein